MKKIVGVLILLLGAPWGFSQAYLEQFHSAVTVDKQGTAWVEETISAVGPSAQGQPPHRDLPAEAQDITLTKNGEPCAFTLQPYADMVRVQFAPSSGSAPQRDVYQLRYHIPQAVTFAPERDELDWNVTGRGFFAINKAVFKLRLPQQAAVSKADVTGFIGSPDNWIEAAGEAEAPQVAADEAAGEISLETMAPIPFGRGLRVVALWRPGFVDAPEDVKWARFKYRYGRWQIPLEVGLLVVLLLGFYYVSLRRKGRKAQGNIPLRQTPPEGFSAAKMLYVFSRGWRELMPVSVCSLAVKGAIGLGQKQTSAGSVQTVLTLQQKEVPFLSDDEKQVLERLFPGENTEFTVGSSNPFMWRRAEADARTSLKRQGAGAYFTRNLAYNLSTLAVVALLVWVGRQCGEFLAAGLSAVFLGIPLFICGYWWAVPSRRLVIKRVFIALFTVGISAFLWYMMRQAGYAGWWFPAIGLTAFAGGLFCYGIQCYTSSGRAVMDQIAGFQLYLRQIGADRDLWAQERQAAQCFCNYLPYAYALGLQKEWINVFILRMDSRLLEQAMRQCGLAAAPEELPQILVDLEQGGVSRVSERKLNRGPLDRRFPRW